jgi:hypothetical protein
VAVVGSAVAVALAGSALASAAAAGTDGMTAALCAEDARVTCSVQSAPTWTEGATGQVAVTGAPGVAVEIGAYRLTDGDPALELLAGALALTTDANGFASTDLRIPALDDGEPAGPVLLAVGDPTGRDLADVLGTWTLLSGRTPVVLGDGYGPAKPVGVDLSLQLDAVVPGTSFDVERLEDGAWQSAGAGSPERCDQPRCAVGYVVPRGLTDTLHDFRLVNLGTGAPVAAWRVRPHATGVPEDVEGIVVPPVGAQVAHSVTYEHGASSNPVPRPRAENLDVPDVAADVVGAGAPTSHPVAMVVWMSAAGAGAALVLSLLMLRRGRS